MKKKALSAIIALIFLVLIVIISMLAFSNWFNLYATGIFQDVESNSAANDLLNLERGIGDWLYLYSSTSETFSEFFIRDLDGNEMCRFEDEEAFPFEGYTRLLFSFDNETISGSNVEDFSGFSNNGTLDGPLYVDSCLSGACFEFDGVDDLINAGSDASLDNIDTISLSAWIKPSSYGEANWGRIVEKYYGPVFLLSNDASEGIASLNFLYYHVGDVFYHQSANNTIGLDVWQHVVATYDLTGPSPELTLYIDGILQTTYQLYSNGGGDRDDSNYDLIIGNNASGQRTFHGLIDELGIYSRILTQKEVEALYKARKAKAYDFILVEGSTKINVSDCNLVRGQRYSFTGFTPTRTIQEEFLMN